MKISLLLFMIVLFLVGCGDFSGEGDVIPQGFTWEIYDNSGYLLQTKANAVQYSRYYYYGFDDIVSVFVNINLNKIKDLHIAFNNNQSEICCDSHPFRQSIDFFV